MLRETTQSVSRGQAPLPWRMQVAYLVLFALGVIAALWQHGEPRLTMGILLVLPLAVAVSRTPRRVLPEWACKLLQAGLGVAAVAWAYVRLPIVRPDMALAEAITVLGVALALRGAPSEYGLLGLLSLMLVGYGGLPSGRTVYVPTAAAFVIVGALLLYATRLQRLGGRRRLVDEHGAEGVRGAVPWPQALLHAGLFVALWVLLSALTPRPTAPSAGWVPVSYAVERPLASPRLWRDWLRDGLFLPGRGGRDTPRQDGQPELGQSGRRIAEPWQMRRTITSTDGSGGGELGRDLVMRIQCREKLYWLASLYDEYDGQRWTTSMALRAVPHGTPPAKAPAGQRRVHQLVRVEKVVSRRLVSAFALHMFRWRGNGPPAEAGEERTEPLIGQHAYGRTLAGPLPSLPWEYSCGSFVPCEPAPGGCASWSDPTTREANLRLPDTLPPRVRSLATALTSSAAAELDRALALRDHLRTSYRYTQNPPELPRRVVPVDFFLFESRQGSCVHFAEALVVLARAAGLPARLATGYSPGNYDTLAGVFDVYEYHGHAWAQVFVQPYGWLTLDGVAPGELRLSTRPPLVGLWRDPFGDEWSVRTPELTLTPRGSAAEALAAESRSEGEEEGGVGAELGQIFYDVVSEARRLSGGRSQPDAWDWTRGLASAGSDHLLARLRDWTQSIGSWFSDTKARIHGAWVAIQAWLAARTWREGVVALGCTGLLVILVRSRSALAEAAATWRRRRRCRRLLRELQTRPSADVVGCLRLCQVLLREALAVEHVKRPPAVDGLEFAEYMVSRDPALADDLCLVSACLFRHLYSRAGVQPREVEIVAGAVVRVTHRALDSRGRGTKGQ